MCFIRQHISNLVQEPFQINVAFLPISSSEVKNILLGGSPDLAELPLVYYSGAPDSNISLPKTVPSQSHSAKPF